MLFANPQPAVRTGSSGGLRKRWCFDQFKAVYPRQNRFQMGVVLVPRSTAELAPALSWLGRYSLRSGDGIPAHAGTLTLWTTRIGVDRDAFMRGLQSKIVAAGAAPSLKA